MFKKISLITLSVFLLASCGSTTEVSTGLSTTELNNFSIQTPSNWEIIEDKENILPKASVGKVEFAMTSSKVVNGFANNMLILSDNITKYTTSKEYSMLNNVGAKTDYLEYREIKSNSFNFKDSEEGMIYIFDARYNLNTPKLRFIQTARICKQTEAYFMTIAIPTNVKDTSKYEYLLSTFTCK